MQECNKKVKLACRKHEDIRGGGSRNPLILDIDMRWRLVLSFTHRLLYHQGGAHSTH